jgi:2-polyprenyl-3-methyl-5-hydroxy-6-metoxy-1,4-benzoquinol methylase
MEHWLTMPVDSKKEVPITHGRVYRCVSCSYGALMPRPEAREIGSFYDIEQYYTHGESHFAPAGSRSFLDRVREHLAWRADRGRGSAAAHIHSVLEGARSDICDIGCGPGLLAAQLTELGHRVIALDLDPQAAEYATRRGVEVLQGSAESLPPQLASRKFDLVVMSHVLEHCLDPTGAIRGACALIRPGGILYCEVPNNACAGFSQAGLAWEMLDIPRHLNFFLPENMCSLTRSAGLHVQSVYYTGYTRQFHNEWINTERRIYDALIRNEGKEAAIPLPVKNSRARAWGLLARTAFSSDKFKYDSVGIIAAKPI